jgi:hypothetical protein
MKSNKLKLTPEWDDFLKSEWKQLDRYTKVGMFGDPVNRIPASTDNSILSLTGFQL